jgi:DmsE family decaheme c-type cytochrome
MAMHERVFRKSPIRYAAFLLLMAGLVMAAQDKPAQPQKAAPVASAPSQVPANATYVGAETCKSCHEDVYKKSFEYTPHYKLIAGGKHGCEDCHGPGSAHVEAGGDPAKIVRFETLSPAQASERCLTCHAQNTEHINFARSVHLQNGVGCLSCHSPHKAKVRETLLIQQQPELCYSCHQQQKAQFAMPFHHKVNEHLVKCTDCHNPHGANIPRQLRTSAGDFAVCFKCHADKEGPFTFEHMPVKTEGCTSCHVPHGSTNPRLLRVSQVNLLCLQCHTPSVTSTAPGTPTFHNQAAKYQACTLCHTQIHGSDLSPVFFK